jgi:hypothetical protein
MKSSSSLWTKPSRPALTIADLSVYFVNEHNSEDEFMNARTKQKAGNLCSKEEIYYFIIF